MNKISSRSAILPIVLALIITLMAPFLIYMSANLPAAGLFLPFLYVLFVIYFWLTEFRTRAHFVVIEEHRISLRSYFGLGSKKIFRYSDFDGFITSQQPGRLGTKEFIFLIRENRREVCISQFYHGNYKALKKGVENKVRFMGEKEYKWGYEYKQMFR